MGEAEGRTATSASVPGLDERLRVVEALLRAGRGPEALDVANGLVATWPDRAEPRVLLGRALQSLGRIDEAIAVAAGAFALAPRHPAARMLQIELDLLAGRTAEGIGRLRALASEPETQGRLLQDVGRLLTQLNLHHEAERCFERGARLAPTDPEVLYNWATALTAVGRLDEAERALDRVLELNPDDGDAYYNRSTLRRQTPERNHVAALGERIRQPPPDPVARLAIDFALAKELEDLGEYAASFAALRRGADLRRQLLRYRVDDDIAAMASIAAAFGAPYLAQAGGGCVDDRPVFIVGLPRSGTTLVDRILSSHSAVYSRGESSDLPAVVMRHGAPARSKDELIARTAAERPAGIGADYCARLPDTSAMRIVDKTPLNFLYVGLLRAALPRARIIHVRRHPLEVCYAMYKTLFRMAYPFSYAFTDLAAYYLAYSRLMAHWMAIDPNSMLEVEYEDLVLNQETVTRRLLDYCGIPWQNECLAFERNAQPTLTASAAQVRQPIYRTSLERTRVYATELEPLARLLRAGGIDLGMRS
jgi:tetratricopeptide (TPR) repeat protein